MKKWDLRFLELAGTVAKWSQDPSTEVGCLVVRDRRILATGYNGFPRGIQDLPERLNHRETKYKYIVHGEMNAIFNAVQHGVSLESATLYVAGLPICSECAKGIIQVGIKRVVIPIQEIPDKWKESCAFTESLFAEVGIVYDKI